MVNVVMKRYARFLMIALQSANPLTVNTAMRRYCVECVGYIEEGETRLVFVPS